MIRVNPRVRSSLLLLFVVVASAGNCPMPPEGQTRPTSVAGTWNGDVLGVHFRLAVTESGRPDDFFNYYTVGGTGWLVYGAPAESVAVRLTGLNGGGPVPLVSFELMQSASTVQTYGSYSAAIQSDGALLGELERHGSREPTPSPWPTRWPAGSQVVSLRLTRQ